MVKSSFYLDLLDTLPFTDLEEYKMRIKNLFIVFVIVTFPATLQLDLSKRTLKLGITPKKTNLNQLQFLTKQNQKKI
jgi:hypothetical protein